MPHRRPSRAAPTWSARRMALGDLPEPRATTDYDADARTTWTNSHTSRENRGRTPGRETCGDERSATVPGAGAHSYLTAQFCRLGPKSPPFFTRVSPGTRSYDVSREPSCGRSCPGVDSAPFEGFPTRFA